MSSLGLYINAKQTGKISFCFGYAKNFKLTIISNPEGNCSEFVQNINVLCIEVVRRSECVNIAVGQKEMESFSSKVDCVILELS